ncbi:MAG: DUF3108 domain-containing protein [Gammaproteobacteria bacterium]|nr:DUF3108 domain-containing protein [Gammaproteobacteria bacterium]
MKTEGKRLKHYFRTIIASSLGGFLILLVNSALAIQINSQTLRYSVEYARQNAGELEVVIDNKDDQLSVTTISHLSLLAKMFLTAQTSTAFFSVQDGQFHLTNGADYLQKDGSLIRDFEVNKTAQSITLLGGETTTTEPDQLLDADSFPIGLMTSEIKMLAGKTVRVVSGKRTRLYRYRAPEEEELDTNSGKLNTWKITRERMDSPQNTVTFWLDQNNNHIPVKIITSKKGKETLLTLTK